MKRIRIFTAGLLALAFTSGAAQWLPGGNTILSPFDYVGTKPASTQPLRLISGANQPMYFLTDSILRMSLNHTVTTGAINGYTGIDQTGYFGLSDQPAFFTGSGPFSKIHLVEAMGSTNPVNYAQVLGFRDWMRNGLTMTGNSDQCYMGAKYNGDDNSDLVLQWSDNPDDAIYGSDRLRFLFTNRRSTTGATYGARSEEGLESFRVFVPNDTSANVGIGDFHRAGIINGGLEDPTERLHVNDGTIRIDSLIPDYQDDTLHQVLMSDLQGRVHWRNINTWPSTGTGTADCKWTLLGVGNANVATAYNGNPGCPQGDRSVGIGLIAPLAKLDVLSKVSEGGPIRGAKVTVKGANTGVNIGIDAYVVPESGTTATQVGIQSRADNATTANTGIAGTGKAYTGSTQTNVGVSGFADVTGGTVSSNYGGDFLSQLNGSGSIVLNRGVNSRAAGGATAQGLWAQGGYGTNNTGVVARGVFGGTGSTNLGVDARADGTGVNNFGVNSLSTNGATNYGVHARAAYGGTNYGVKAVADNGSVINYGVHSTATGAGNWAGYFVGDVMINGTGFYTGMAPIASDIQLKTNIETLPNGSEILAQLRATTYDMRTDEFPSIHMSERHQYGLIAQEVEEVLPDLVTEVTVPAVVDSMGNVIHEAETIKALNYFGFIPVLISAGQQQQATIDAQQATIADLNDRLAQMEARLDGCCSGSPSDGRSNATEEGNGNSSTFGNDRTLRIVPNPMQDQATIYYQMERSGRMQLLANSADGKELSVLKEAQMEAGNYQHAWTTVGMAPGVYYVTLLLDGEPITKKVIKITP